ncbi:SLC13 family permease [Halorubellus sp. JP-L1]|uniref:SLC13 family permease n=1 Tax=Halorubellus sp. JP-L1 TaxID=2715753 RepID=UPI0014099AD5|nr:SLC13 family permease [Halorubellus sp. JP-L1]
MVALTPEIAVVSLVIAAALVLFATEVVPVDVTALGVLVALLVVSEGSQYLATLGLLADPVVLVTPQEGISGFASTATITVLAMFILSDGVQRTGIVAILGRKMAAFTRDDENRQLGVTMGVVAPISGFINNTAAVAILLPMVTDLAHKGNTSPSKLLIPLSYASMFGGTLTLIGTSTNILASEIAATLYVPDDPVFAGLEGGFSMFEFTALGAIVTVVGFAYFYTVGTRLLPERIPPKADLTEEFQLADYLTEVEVREDSPIVGQTVHDALVETDFDVDLVQLIRNGETFLEPLGPKTIQAGDVFAVRTDRDTLVELVDADGLDLVPDVVVDDDELEIANERENLVEVVIAPGSALVNESLASIRFRQRYDATVLALRRGDELFRNRMDHVRLRVGDTLLVQGTPETIERMDANRDFIVAQEIERKDWRTARIPVALAIVAGVVGFAAAGVLPIVVSALAGALAMILTGCLEPGEVYDAVQWDVIVLLAGVIPLGIAMESSGSAALVADTLVQSATLIPPIALLGAFYVVTAALTNVISNNASVVLMIPVAAETAIALDAWAFPFILAVTFAASTAFMTPVGYQTNLFVYGPGGYKFTDYLRVGTPLQAIFAVVTTLGIYHLWGLTPPA